MQVFLILKQGDMKFSLFFKGLSRRATLPSRVFLLWPTTVHLQILECLVALLVQSRFRFLLFPCFQIHTTGIVRQQQISDSDPKSYASIPVCCQFQLRNLFVMFLALRKISWQMFADKDYTSHQDSSLYYYVTPTSFDVYLITSHPNNHSVG